MRVYVHLAYGFDARTWRQRWESGELLGINDPTPYGYHRAEKLGARLVFSEDHPERLPIRVLRQGLRVLLGFDLVHAWRNRRRIEECDVVWTHTESNHLGVAAVLAFRSTRCHSRPKLLAQSVWLFDNWHRMSPTRQYLFRYLMKHADILTVHSPCNQIIAERLFPNHRVELVRFGISVDTVRPPQPRGNGGVLNVLGVGNDRHRDWETLLQAVAPLDIVRLRIVSRSLAPAVVERFDRVELALPECNADLMALYDWADVVVVPLRENQHASGITVCQEAAVRGVPVIASDVGGLRDYFDDSSLVFVPAQDVTALRTALADLQTNPDRRHRVAEAAQARMGADGLSSESFARAHVQISSSLLQPASMNRRG